jgi:putative flippase GtrA
VVRLVRFLPQRLRHLAPEAFAFGAIGLGNLVLYGVIFNVLLFIGAVKATVIATLVTTYLAYLANRHWTYKHRPRRALRREYTLFFAVNLVGMVIGATGNAIVKYGFGLTEHGHELVFNIATAICICIATVFRFWTYRAFVFKDAPAQTATMPAGQAAEAATNGGQPVAELPVVAPAEGIPLPAQAHRDPADAEFEQLAASMATELDGDTNPEGAARIH